MTSSPTTLWQIDGTTMETVRDFILWGSKITADGDCSHEIRRCLLLGRKAMTNLDSILKSRDIILPTKIYLVKAMVFPVVMYRCESWTIKEAECWRTDAFELWCWRRLLRVAWSARRSNQSILKEINPAYSVEGLMLKLKLQYSGHLMWRATSLEKTLMLLGRAGDDRGQDGWMASSTQWTWVWASSGRWWRTGKPGVLQSMGSQSQTWLRNWTRDQNPSRKKVGSAGQGEASSRKGEWSVLAFLHECGLACSLLLRLCLPREEANQLGRGCLQRKKAGEVDGRVPGT